MCDYDHYKNKLRSSFGPDCIVEVLDELTKLSNECIARRKNSEGMQMTADDTRHVLHAVLYAAYRSIAPLQKKKTLDHHHNTRQLK